MAEWTMKSKSFSGTLSIDSYSLNVQFKVALSKAGEAIIDLAPLTYNTETLFISQYIDQEESRFSEFTLSGKAEDSTTFHCEDIIFPALNRQIFEGVCSICPKSDYSKVQIEIPAQSPGLPLVKWHLKGFEAFHELSASTRLGRLQMVGAMNAAVADEITGFLAVKAESLPPSLLEWREEVEKLCQHVRYVMSFAVGKVIGFPIKEFNHESRASVEVFSQSNQLDTGMPTFNRLNLATIFECAVRSYFEPPIIVKNLEFAIQWFLMRGAYREANLISSMTVLENLIDSNLSQGDALILTPKKFEQLRKKLSKVVKDEAINWTDKVDEQAAYVKELNDRFSDLKRKSLIDKVKLLAIQWGVRLDGINDDSIRAAKIARDHVVHQGSYQAKPGDTLDLHDHLLTTRELVVRFILTALGFEGKYYTFIGGWNEVLFLRGRTGGDLISETAS